MARWPCAMLALALAACASAPTIPLASGQAPSGPFRVIEPTVGPPTPAPTPPPRVQGRILTFTFVLRNSTAAAVPLPRRLKARARALVNQLNSLDDRHRRALVAELYRELADRTVGDVGRMMAGWNHDPDAMIAFLEHALATAQTMDQTAIDTALASLPEGVDIGYRVALDRAAS